MIKYADDDYKNSRASSADDIEFIAQRDDTSNNYEMRMSASEEPQVPAGNLQNLFDDSDHEDSKWLMLAKKHLSRWTSRR